MARRPTQGPTDAELEILNILWHNGPSTVRDVFDGLNRLRNTGYTTALKLLQIMSEKELVTRDETRRSHVYVAAVTRESVQLRLVDSLLNRLFDGSCAAMLAQALRTRQITASELDAMQRAIDELRRVH